MTTIKFCSGCQRHDEQVVASDWCSACVELVCDSCAKVHRKFDPPHQIVPVGQMEEFYNATDNWGRFCDAHGRQKVVKYCIRHDNLLCEKCVTENHIHCKGVVSIETAAKNMKQISSIENIRRRISCLQELSMSIVKRKSENIILLNNQRDSLAEMISTMRERINNHLDKIENDLRKEMEQKFGECMTSIENKKSEIESGSLDLQTWLMHLELVKTTSDASGVFRAIKALEGKINKMEENVNEGRKTTKQEQMVFQAHKNVLKLPTLVPSFGHFIKSDKSYKHTSNVPTPPQSPRSPKIMKNIYDIPNENKNAKEEGSPRRTYDEHDVPHKENDKKVTHLKSASVPSLSSLLQTFAKTKTDSDLVSTSSRELPVSNISVEKSIFRHCDKVRKTQSVENKPNDKIHKSLSIPESNAHDQCLPCPGTKRRKVTLSTQLDAVDFGNNVAFGKGCFIPGERLLLPHYSGQFLYITDCEGRSMLKIKLDCDPWDVVSVNESTAIVTMKKKGIQILDLKTMKLSKFIKPGGSGCWAISASINGIWVERNDNSVHMIDINGNILRKIITQHKLWDFCVSATGNIFYVTSLQSVVYIIKTNGTHEIFYSSSDLREPSSVAVDEYGSVYVTGRGSDNVHRISADGAYYDIILKRQDGIYRPSALCYNKEDKKLMVINNCNRNAMIFTML